MIYSGNYVCGNYGSTPWDNDPCEWGMGEIFIRDMSTEFEINGFFAPYKDTTFIVEADFVLERNQWGEWAHTITKVVGYHEGDENTGMLIIAGITENEINTHIESKYYNDSILED